MRTENERLVVSTWKAVDAAKKVEAEAKRVWVETETVEAWQNWQNAEDAVEAARRASDNAVNDCVCN